ncbi:ARPP-1 family domain-containing protein [Gemmata sp.]|uniref:ARPP-1 family domain-containing protein n=1 Tax=Gemmata sp. TaxID=1914242 RepID=UPI003F70FD5C
MKSSHAAFGVVALALAGLWFAGGGAAAPARSATAAEQPRVSAPLTHGNLTVFFVHGPDAVSDAHKVATLAEALDAGWAVVHETGNVNTLQVENNSDDYELFVQEGDIIKGGRQDRVFATDMLVPPKSGRVPFPAHCVEAGRWQGRGAEASTHFTKSDQRIVGSKLAYANATRQQSEVWDNVKENQDKFTRNLGTTVNAPDSATSFQLTLENKTLQQKVAEFEAALRAGGEGKRNVIGCVFLVNGQVTGAEVYGSNAMFQKAWPRLLRSQAADAVAEQSDRPLPPVPTVPEVERFLALAGQQPSAAACDGAARQDSVALNCPGPAPARNFYWVEDGLGQPNAPDTAVNPIVTANGSGQALVQQQESIQETVQLRNRTDNQRQRLQQYYGMRGSNVAVNPQPAAAVQTPAAAGNRLNVQRVEDAAGLSSESRDAGRGNALIHKSFIKK